MLALVLSLDGDERSAQSLTDQSINRHHMPRSAHDNQVIRDARREEILEAARVVFTEKGFKTSKIADVAARAALSHGLVYHYFRSKDAVFSAMAEGVLERWQKDAAVPPGRAIDEIREIIVRTLVRMQDSSSAHRCVMQAYANGEIPDEVRVRLERTYRRAQRQYVARIERGQREGDIDDTVSAEDLANLLMCCVRGMAIVFKAPKGLAWKLPSVDVVMRLLRPRRATGRSTQLAAVPSKARSTTASSPTGSSSSRSTSGTSSTRTETTSVARRSPSTKRSSAAGTDRVTRSDAARQNDKKRASARTRSSERHESARRN